MSLQNSPTRSTASAPRRGVDFLHDPAWNKGTAFTEAERDALGLRGLLPPRVVPMDEQLERVVENYRNKDNDLERFIYLSSLQDRNEVLFYRLLIEHIEEMMPIVYTPTVGTACQRFGHIWRRAHGMYVSAADRGRIRDVLGNWRKDDVRVIVVTDGERILGLGDLGANGMGIPIGKLALYSACAGVHPQKTLPIMLDTGTNNPEIQEDRLYLGLRQPRLRGEEYDSLVEEFVTAANDRWPGVLIQFEDFANANSFRLLEKYRDRVCTFNDDIQGTAAVTLAGLLSALRITKKPITEQRVLFLGAGSAGVGIGRLIAAAMETAGLTEAEARKRCFFVDSGGLVVKSREGLAEHKLDFAHDMKPAPDFLAAIRTLKPTAIIGVSGRPGSFTKEIVEAMAEINERPIVFALSNPTSKAEVTAEDCYRWSDGRAIFASGSPFAPVKYKGRTLVPGQGNNAYIFPGLGLGLVATSARRVTDEMLTAAAWALAGDVSEKDLETGCLFPPLKKIRETSFVIATEVAKLVFARGLAGVPEPEDLEEFLRDEVFEPVYPDFSYAG